MTTKDTNENCAAHYEDETCSTTKESKLTTVKTVYARAALVLLALNFCLTGYVVYNMNQTTQAQIDGITGSTGTSQTTQQAATQASTTTEGASQTTDTETGQGSTASPVTTRDK